MPAAARHDGGTAEAGQPTSSAGSPAALARLASFVRVSARSDQGEGRVLVVVADPELAALLGYCLWAAGFLTVIARDRKEALAHAEHLAPDVVLLDLRSPDFTGTAVGRAIQDILPRERRPATIMFIHDGNDIDPALGLDFGPCDFVVYPFDVRDLVLRIDGIIRSRRTDPPARQDQRRRRYLVGPLELDIDRQTAVVLGTPTHVSAVETRLLAYLIEHRGRVRSRGDMLVDVWGYRAGVATRTADTHINRLRGKLGQAADLIETVRGKGYRLSLRYPVEVRD